MKKQAIFAGGCFWCLQPAFDRTGGVINTRVGFTGGKLENPTYEQVCTGQTGHYEAILVEYDDSQVTYAKLLDVFWKTIDPTQADGQFADRGSHYRTAVFYQNDEERELASGNARELQRRFDKPIMTAILPATPFYDAEEYHQRYYEKNPAHYEAYKVGSGRAGFIKRTWNGD